MSGNNLKRSRMYFNKYCVNYKITSSGTKRLLIRQTFGKNRQFSSRKKFRLIVFRIIEFDQRQGTTNKGTKGLLTSFLQALYSFLQDLRSREATFSKKGYRPEEKRFWPFFSPTKTDDEYRFVRLR